MKSRVFDLYNFLHIAQLPNLNLRGFEPRDYARTLSFEKVLECTSQGPKRTSGARIRILFFDDSASKRQAHKLQAASTNVKHIKNMGSMYSWISNLIPDCTGLLLFECKLKESV